MRRRICFPVDDELYRKIVRFCDKHNLTRAGLFCELMDAYISEREPHFPEESRPDDQIKASDPTPKVSIQGGGIHNF